MYTPGTFCNFLENKTNIPILFSSFKNWTHNQVQVQSSHSSFPTLQVKFTGKTRTKTKTRARPRPRPNHEMTNIWTKCNPYQEQLSGTGNLSVLYENFDNYVMKINNKWIIVGLIGRLIYLMFGKFGLIHFFFLDF